MTCRELLRIHQTVLAIWYNINVPWYHNVSALAVQHAFACYTYQERLWFTKMRFVLIWASFLYKTWLAYKQYARNVAKDEKVTVLHLK